jgi:ankyrin repeat protein
MLKSCFGGLPPSLLDVLRQRLFVAAITRNNPSVVRAMLELGFDPREPVFVDDDDDVKWRTILPLRKALKLGQHSIAKILVSHLARVERGAELEALLQQINDVARLCRWGPITLPQWMELIHIPIAAGSMPTVDCFWCTSSDAEVEGLLFGNGKIEAHDWVEQDLLANCLGESAWCEYGRPQTYDNMSRRRRILTYLLEDKVKSINTTEPKVRLALLKAFKVALQQHTHWASRMIYLFGERMDPPLVGTEHDQRLRVEIRDACASDDWDVVHDLVHETPSSTKCHYNYRREVTNVKSRTDLQSIVKKINDLCNLSELSFEDLGDICSKAAKYELDDIAISAISAQKLVAKKNGIEGQSGLLTLLLYVRVSAVSALIRGNKRFAEALDSAIDFSDYTQLENLLYRCRMSRKKRKFPAFTRYDTSSNLQVVLRALSYYAIAKCNLRLMEWLLWNGLEADGLCYDMYNMDMNPGEWNTVAEYGIDMEKLSETSQWFRQLPGSKRILPSLLSVTAQRNERELMKVLIRSGAKNKDSQALRHAVRVGADAATIELLLSAASNDTTPSSRRYGVGAIREAICQGNIDLVRYLSTEVDINRLDTTDRDDQPLSPMGEAIQCLDYKSAQILIDSGADPNAIVAWFGMHKSKLDRLTSLLAAISKGSLSMVELLAKAGAELDHGPKLGILRTPLQSAAELGKFEIVKFLLEQGVPVDNAPFYSGGTPLQLAAMSGWIDVATLLLENGANVNHMPAEGDGRTAFEAAAEWGRVDMLTLLAQWGVDLDLLVEPELLHQDGNEHEDDEDDDEEEEKVYGTQYQRAIFFAERNGQMATKRFVQQIALDLLAPEL